MSSDQLNLDSAYLPLPGLAVSLSARFAVSPSAWIETCLRIALFNSRFIYFFFFFLKTGITTSELRLLPSPIFSLAHVLHHFGVLFVSRKFLTLLPLCSEMKCVSFRWIVVDLINSFCLHNMAECQCHALTVPVSFDCKNL